MVVALGVAWVLDGLEITIASNVGPLLTQKSTLGLTASSVADIAKSLQDVARPLSVIAKPAQAIFRTGGQPPPRTT
jgi:hypothetical protein